MRPTVAAALAREVEETQSKHVVLSPLLAVHAWWTKPVWYNLVFGVGAIHLHNKAGMIVQVPITTAPTLAVVVEPTAVAVVEAAVAEAATVAVARYSRWSSIEEGTSHLKARRIS
jgi:hypothetical protein